MSAGPSPGRDLEALAAGTLAPSELLAALDRLRDIVVDAGALARERLQRHEPASLVHKRERDYQTRTDRDVERAVADALRTAFPGCGIHGEERVADAIGDAEGEYGGVRFLIDPIDGTTNFAWGIPHFAVVAAMQVRGETVAGVVHDPVLGETFGAAVGCGASLNGSPVSASIGADPVNAVFGAGLPVPGQVVSIDEAIYHRALRRLMDTSAGVRRHGSAALSLAWVACGRLDGFFEDGLAPHDYAAAALICREAGGTVTRFDGSPVVGVGAVLAAGPGLHRWLLDGFA